MVLKNRRTITQWNPRAVACLSSRQQYAVKCCGQKEVKSWMEHCNMTVKLRGWKSTTVESGQKTYQGSKNTTVKQKAPGFVLSAWRGTSHSPRPRRGSVDLLVHCFMRCFHVFFRSSILSIEGLCNFGSRSKHARLPAFTRGSGRTE